MKLKVRCPHCKMVQSYLTYKPIVRGTYPFVGKSKKCIKCDRSFVVYTDIKKHNILDFEPKSIYD